jgi:Concanavalin A-like lectin/glucanases superfamily/FecR protein
MDERLDELLLRLADGELTPAEVDELCALLEGGPAARAMAIDSLVADSQLAELSLRRPCGEGRGLPHPTGERSPLADDAGVARRPWLPWAIAATACVFALLAGLVAWRRPDGAPHRPQPGAVAGQDGEGPAGGGRRASATASGIAAVINQDGAVWETADGTLPPGGVVLPARRLRLRSGRATLAFLNGVMLTMEGPADLDLVSIDRVFCRRGRLRARVPQGAEGFVVAAPGSSVVDLGTEFALNVEDDGRARVMVFEGQVEAALLDASGAAKRTQWVERSQAFDLDPHIDRITEAVARPDLFVSRMAPTASSLALDPTYPRAVLESRPKGYWRFESLAGGAFPNEVPGGPPLRVGGPVTLARGPRGNGCAVFKAEAPEQFLDTDGLWELAGTPGHAVELWFSAEGYRGASLIGLYPPVTKADTSSFFKYSHCFLLETIGRGGHSLHKPASVRFLDRSPDVKAGDNVYSEEVYLPHRWHHVVAQKVGDWIELFFDGVPGQPLQLMPDHPDVSCRLVVGRRAPATEEPNEPRPFVGRLDELAIYDHPLSAEDVRSHFRLAAPKPGPR